MRNHLMGAGLVIAFMSLVWWHNEVKSFLGDRAAEDSGRCVYNLGTDDCANFWLAGIKPTRRPVLYFMMGCLWSFSVASPASDSHKAITGHVS